MDINKICWSYTTIHQHVSDASGTIIRVSYKNTNNTQIYDLLPDDEPVGFKDVEVPLLSYSYECVND